MFLIEDGNIEVIQGDTGILTLALDDYLFKDGDVVNLTVRKTVPTNEETEPWVLYKYITTFNDGVCEIQFTEVDTKNIPIGRYFYDIRVRLVDGRVDTVVLPSKFTVKGSVTKYE